MIGVELVRDRQTKERATTERDAVVQAAFQRGLLVLGARQERGPLLAAARADEGAGGHGRRHFRRGAARTVTADGEAAQGSTAYRGVHGPPGRGARAEAWPPETCRHRHSLRGRNLWHPVALCHLGAREPRSAIPRKTGRRPRVPRARAARVRNSCQAIPHAVREVDIVADDHGAIGVRRGRQGAASKTLRRRGRSGHAPEAAARGAMALDYLARDRPLDGAAASMSSRSTGLGPAHSEVARDRTTRFSGP